MISNFSKAFLLLFTFTSVLHFNSEAQQFDQGVLSKGELNLFHQEERNFAKQRNSFLNYVTCAQESSLIGKFAESNNYYEKAYWLLYSNRHRLPKTEEFGFSYEGFMVQYMKAINFFVLEKPESALIECNRMRDWLASDEIGLTKDHFNTELFPHMLLGLLYEAENMPNDAFIEYQLSYNLFQEGDDDFFGAYSKERIQIAMLRTSWAAGLHDKFYSLQEEFNLRNFKNQGSPGGTLTLICHMGVGPHQRDQDEPADFQTNANSQFGFLMNMANENKYGFENDFVLNQWRNQNWWTSLPRGIFHVTVPLQIGPNEFTMKSKDSLGIVKDLKFIVCGTGTHQLRVINSFDKVSSEDQIKITIPEAEIYLYADYIQGDSTQTKLEHAGSETIEENEARQWREWKAYFDRDGQRYTNRSHHSEFYYSRESVRREGSNFIWK